MAAPFTVVATKMIEGWFPPSNPQLNEIIHLLKEQNRLKREELRCESPKVVRQLYRHERIAEEFLEQHREKAQIIRSITSQAFKNIFRPIGRSAHQAHLVDGLLERPFGAINEENIAMLAADEVDKDDVVVWGVMNTFSPPSQTGIMYSRDYETTFRVEYNSPDKLPRQNDFSWSLYMGKPIRFFGRFVRYFDGSIKKFLAVRVERVTDEAEIESYFKR